LATSSSPTAPPADATAQHGRPRRLRRSHARAALCHPLVCGHHWWSYGRPIGTTSSATAQRRWPSSGPSTAVEWNTASLAYADRLLRAQPGGCPTARRSTSYPWPSPDGWRAAPADE
jgi:hypothetical protein